MHLVISAAAVIAGALTAAVLYQVGAAFALLVTVGIPLGSSGEPPGADYFALNLGCALVAAAAGGHLTRRLSRISQWWSGIVLALLLALLSLWGFTRPGSQWPAWYPPVLALVAAVGILAAPVTHRLRGSIS